VSGLQVVQLGPLSVERDGVTLDLGGPLPRTLMTVLAAAAGRAVSAGRLVDEMWEAPPAAAEAALSSYVSRLRGVLEPGRRPGEPSVLRRDRGGYALVLPDEAFDVTRFRRQVAEGRAALLAGSPTEALPLLTAALELWRGDLPPLDELPLSVRPDAIRLLGERQAARDDVCEARLQLGRHVEVIAELEAALAASPLQERTGQQLALALYRSGRQPEALSVLRELVARLDEEYGLEPRPELRALERALLAQDPALELPVATSASVSPVPAPVDASPVEPAATGLRKIPVPLTPIIGRRRLITSSSHLLGTERLVTLTGPAGTGKTRLSLELAGLAQVAETGWVPLAEVSDTSEVDTALCAAVGLAVAANTPPRRALTTGLAERDLLLVIDNAEHVREAVAGTVVALLAEAPGVRVLVSSRVPLGIAGERLVDVPPLGLDGEDGESAAVRLFLDRASAVAPGWQPDPADRRAADALCRRLEGLPLALELAAARARDLAPEEILAGLDDWPELLVGGGSVTPHHGSLSAAVRWSYELLSPADQQAFRALAVFDGGFDLSSAAAVVGPGAVDSVARLAGGSLLVTDRAARPRRYRMLHVLREWALSRTPPEERRIHARALELWAADLARSVGPHLRHPVRGVESLRRCRLELPNLRVALRTGLLEGDPLLTLQALTDLSPLWMCGNPEEGLDQLLLALDAVGDEAPVESLARARLAVAQLAWIAGDSERGMTSAQQAATLAGLADDLGRLEGLEDVTAVAVSTTGYMHLLRGELDAARRQLDIAGELASGIAGPAGANARANVLVTRGMLSAATGAYEEALRLLDLAAPEWAAAEDWPVLIGGAFFAERVALLMGHAARVVSHCARAAVLSADLGAESTLVMHAQTAAGGLTQLARPVEAVRLLAAARVHAARLGLHLDFTDPAYAQEVRRLVRAGVDDEQWAAADGEGAAWGRHQLVDALRTLAAA
jgi:predicted ATPase/DNA-binding SARP family transcriptional activator